MPSQLPKPPEENPIEKRISALVARLQAREAGDSEYNLESSFVEQLKKSKRSGKAVSLVELAQQLSYERERHDFDVEREKHRFRKLFLWCLFGLTCFWLLVVIVFVTWNAVSPSVENREKLMQLQIQVAASSSPTNTLNGIVARTVTPHFCSALFHLSDSVLIAFITSTTVAVLGLFLTAANWLYGKPLRKKISHPHDKHEQVEETN